MNWSDDDPLRARLQSLLELLERREGGLQPGETREVLGTLRKALTDAEELATRGRIYRETIRERNEALESKILELSVLKQIGDLIAGSLRFDDLLGRVLDVLVRELHVENCSIMLLDENTGELRIEAGRGTTEGEPYGGPEMPELRLGEGIAGWVAASREPLIVHDVSRDLRFKHLGGGGTVQGALICVPLIAEQQVLGVLNLSSSLPGSFGPSDVRILRIVANQFASALVGMELHRELRRFSDRLEEQVGDRTEELQRRTRDLRRRNDQVTRLYFSLERAQRELEERNRDLVEALTFIDNIVETVNVGICVVDSGRKVVTWNRSMDSITGGLLTKEEVLGRRLDELPEKVREDFALGTTLVETLARGCPVTRHDHVVVLPGGTTRHLNVHHLPISMATDGNVEVITVLEDITDNVGLHEQKVKSERLAAINETMVSVNHEVNNPLAVILGYAQILLRKSERGDAPEEWVESAVRDLKRIEQEAIRIREITRKLATLVEPVVTSYPAAGDVRMVDVNKSR